MRALGIGGVPASGKSTLMRKILAELGPPAALEFGLLKGTGHALGALPVFVFGLYDGTAFEGTDRLSMAVQPMAEAFLRALTTSDGVVIFEGDRLFNRSFLTTAKSMATATRYVVLEAPEDVVKSRHVARADTQTSKFLQGRDTKYRNLLANTALGVEARTHATKEDTAALAAELLSWAKSLG